MYEAWEGGFPDIWRWSGGVVEGGNGKRELAHFRRCLGIGCRRLCESYAELCPIEGRSEYMALDMHLDLYNLEPNVH